MSEKKRDAIKKKCEKLAEFLTETNDILGDTFGVDQMFCFVSRMDGLWIRLGDRVKRLQALRKNGKNSMSSEEEQVVAEIAGLCILLLCEDDNIHAGAEEEQDDYDDFEDFDDADYDDETDTAAVDEPPAAPQKPKKSSKKK
ncbi:MAG: hypothetical protein IKE64_13970 [Thermoguttaceae bacterium]|nr:hypothetical protein [Thermoguttaceae bacterium]